MGREDIPEGYVANLLNEYGYADDETIIFNDEYHTALIGVDSNCRAVYDYELMVEWLMSYDDMTDEEAREWIDFNVIRSLPYLGDHAPIILFRIDD